MGKNDRPGDPGRSLWFFVEIRDDLFALAAYTGVEETAFLPEGDGIHIKSVIFLQDFIKGL